MKYLIQRILGNMKEVSGISKSLVTHSTEKKKINGGKVGRGR